MVRGNRPSPREGGSLRGPEGFVQSWRISEHTAVRGSERLWGLRRKRQQLPTLAGKVSLQLEGRCAECVLNTPLFSSASTKVS